MHIVPRRSYMPPSLCLSWNQHIETTRIYTVFFRVNFRVVCVRMTKREKNGSPTIDAIHLFINSCSPEFRIVIYPKCQNMTRLAQLTHSVVFFSMRRAQHKIFSEQFLFSYCSMQLFLSLQTVGLVLHFKSEFFQQKKILSDCQF